MGHFASKITLLLHCSKVNARCAFTLAITGAMEMSRTERYIQTLLFGGVACYTPASMRPSFGDRQSMGEKETKGAVRLEEDRPQFLLRLFLTAVTGFNLVLAFAQLYEANWIWVITLGVMGVAVPGMIPFLRLIQTYKEGRIPLSWR